MATKLKRVTITITKEMEQVLKQAKKETFYDCNQSKMLRELVMIGLNSLNENKAK